MVRGYCLHSVHLHCPFMLHLHDHHRQQLTNSMPFTVCWKYPDSKCSNNYLLSYTQLFTFNILLPKKISVVLLWTDHNIEKFSLLWYCHSIRSFLHSLHISVEPISHFLGHCLYMFLMQRLVKGISSHILIYEMPRSPGISLHPNACLSDFF